MEAINPRSSAALLPPDHDDAVLAEVLRCGPETFVVLDPDTAQIEWVSERVTELSGWMPADLVGRRIQDFDSLVPDDPTWSQMASSLPLGAAMVLNGRFRCRDGSRLSTEVRLTVLEIGGRRRMVAGAREVEARSRVESRLRERDTTLTAVIGALRDGVLVVDTDGMVTMANPRAAELAGLSLNQILDRPVLDVLDLRLDEQGVPVPESESPLLHTLATGEPVNGLIHGVRGQDPRWLLVNTAAIVDPTNGEVQGAVATNADITELVRARAELEELASRDGLTGLANRGAFQTRLHSALETSRSSGDVVALLFLDLDGFKRVNDTLGHSQGDHLLQMAAVRIADQLRPTDFVARIGGDEFVILLPSLGRDEMSAAQVAEEVADRVVRCLTEPFDLTTKVVRVSASVGIALSGAAIADVEAEELLRQADLAMYAAKEVGGVGHCIFDERMDAEAQRAMHLEVQLAKAIELEDLAIHLQPRLDIATGALTGAEALLRWNDPTAGPVDTAAIVATAERTGLIVRLGRWVIAETIRQAVTLRDAGVLLPHMTVSVNISCHQLQHDDFVPELVAMLDEAGLSPRSLTVELTESAVMADLYQSRKRLRELEEIGIPLSIDDFGTGYSSLAYLRDLPVRELKLDRLFVADLGRDPVAEVILRGVIDIALGLGIDTVAEGVERPEQLEFLRSTGCHHYQGFLTSAAIPLAEFLSRYGR
ncbi:MAG: EAL domain-containing protein [Acidimicrobiales bacterium]|nr:EAL domain-containing protein [Acidimicrobiales bacterium]